MDEEEYFELLMLDLNNINCEQQGELSQKRLDDLATVGSILDPANPCVEWIRKLDAGSDDTDRGMFGVPGDVVVDRRRVIRNIIVHGKLTGDACNTFLRGRVEHLTQARERIDNRLTEHGSMRGGEGGCGRTTTSVADTTEVFRPTQLQQSMKAHDISEYLRMHGQTPPVDIATTVADIHRQHPLATTLRRLTSCPIFQEMLVRAFKNMDITPEKLTTSTRLPWRRLLLQQSYVCQVMHSWPHWDARGTKQTNLFRVRGDVCLQSLNVLTQVATTVPYLQPVAVIHSGVGSFPGNNLCQWANQLRDVPMFVDRDRAWATCSKHIMDEVVQRVRRLDEEAVRTVAKEPKVSVPHSTSDMRKSVPGPDSTEKRSTPGRTDSRPLAFSLAKVVYPTMEIDQLQPDSLSSGGTGGISTRARFGSIDLRPVGVFSTSPYSTVGEHLVEEETQVHVTGGSRVDLGADYGTVFVPEMTWPISTQRNNLLTPRQNERKRNFLHPQSTEEMDIWSSCEVESTFHCTSETKFAVRDFPAPKRLSTTPIYLLSAPVRSDPLEQPLGHLQVYPMLVPRFRAYVYDVRRRKLYVPVRLARVASRCCPQSVFRTQVRMSKTINGDTGQEGHEARESQVDLTRYFMDDAGLDGEMHVQQSRDGLDMDFDDDGVDDDDDLLPCISVGVDRHEPLLEVEYTQLQSTEKQALLASFASAETKVRSVDLESDVRDHRRSQRVSRSSIAKRRQVGSVEVFPMQCVAFNPTNPMCLSCAEACSVGQLPTPQSHAHHSPVDRNFVVRETRRGTPIIPTDQRRNVRRNSGAVEGRPARNVLQATLQVIESDLLPDIEDITLGDLYGVTGTHTLQRQLTTLTDEATNESKGRQVFPAYDDDSDDEKMSEVGVLRPGACLKSTSNLGEAYTYGPFVRLDVYAADKLTYHRWRKTDAAFTEHRLQVHERFQQGGALQAALSYMWGVVTKLTDPSQQPVTTTATARCPQSTVSSDELAGAQLLSTVNDLWRNLVARRSEVPLVLNEVAIDMLEREVKAKVDACAKTLYRVCMSAWIDIYNLTFGTKLPNMVRHGSEAAILRLLRECLQLPISRYARGNPVVRQLLTGTGVQTPDSRCHQSSNMASEASSETIDMAPRASTTPYSLVSRDTDELVMCVLRKYALERKDRQYFDGWEMPSISAVDERLLQDTAPLFRRQTPIELWQTGFLNTDQAKLFCNSQYANLRRMCLALFVSGSRKLTERMSATTGLLTEARHKLSSTVPEVILAAEVARLMASTLVFETLQDPFSGKCLPGKASHGPLSLVRLDKVPDDVVNSVGVLPEDFANFNVVTAANTRGGYEGQHQTQKLRQQTPKVATSDEYVDVKLQQKQKRGLRASNLVQFALKAVGNDGILHTHRLTAGVVDLVVHARVGCGAVALAKVTQGLGELHSHTEDSRVERGQMAVGEIGVDESGYICPVCDVRRQKEEEVRQLAVAYRADDQTLTNLRRGSTNATSSTPTRDNVSVGFRDVNEVEEYECGGSSDKNRCDQLPSSPEEFIHVSLQRTTFEMLELTKLLNGDYRFEVIATT